MRSKKIACLVVTYNRKELLSKVIEAIACQSITPDRLYIIDNASTDGTEEFVRSLQDTTNLDIYYTQLSENLGGAGGFEHGLKKSYDDGFDFTWLMDDDCIPNRNALEFLMQPFATDIGKIGFVCSRVNWTNNEPHLMNLPLIKPLVSNKPFNIYEHLGFLLIQSCSFVSVLINSQVFSKAGFPFGKMFIWGDDVEYFMRITSNDFIGLYCSRSIVVHKTSYNCNDDFIHSAPEALWKHWYGIRNNLYIHRRHKGLIAYWENTLFRLFGTNLKIIFSDSTNKIKLLKINSSATIASIFFDPERGD